ncbi:zinc finger protein 334-like isoform X1 [Ambystoma mexicanum]|uniref:zinc finger protein 334-like isoform X1 n=1 Tax=Ambystoma mexicanum TaxID=8296 RepID=UPI0037E74F70
MAELTPVTFKDVAVCFSEDEWRLLAEWEKQLYRNVMLEIHGALISLGYAIVNTDVVFRIKKAEVPHPWGQQPQKGRENTSCGTAGYSSINPDLLLRITRQEEPCALDDQALEENKSSDDSSIGHSCVTSPIPIKLKREEEQNGMKSHDCKRTESVNNPTSTHPVVTSVFSLRVKQEEEALYPDFCGFERRKCVNSTTSTRTIIPDVPRQILQGKPDFISHHLSSGKATARNGSTSSWSANRNVEEDEILELNRMFQTNSKECRLQDHDMGIPITGEISIKRELEETEFGQNKFIDCGKSLHQWIDPIIELETHVRDSSLAHEMCMSIGNNQSNWSVYQRTHRGELLYKCSDCKKTFYEESKLIVHQRTHFGERKYQCNECAKLFKNKYCLLKHWRIHTGEKPYKCTNCERSFTQDSSLIVHQRTHNGERPYKCPECDKCFTCSSNLIRHRRTHTGLSFSRALQ